MSNPTYDHLVGTEMFASIGEPWDFESRAGVGLLRGVITSIPTTENGVLIIRCIVEEFDFRGTSYCEVVAVNRYCTAQRDLLQTLITKKSAGVNFYYLKGSPSLDDSTIINELFPVMADDKFLIGSIRFESKPFVTRLFNQFLPQKSMKSKVRAWFRKHGGGTLYLPDGWFGRPYDNIHMLVAVTETPSSLTVVLADGVSLCFEGLKAVATCGNDLVFIGFDRCEFVNLDDGNAVPDRRVYSGGVVRVISSAVVSI